MTMKRWLQEGCRLLGLELPASSEQNLLKYLELLIKWNNVINLTGTRDEHSLVLHHVVDCLAVLHLLPARALRLIDVGSGAGLPGAIVAIVRPDISVTALEPLSRKHAFLATIRRELELDNFHPVNLRLESHLDADDFEPYDVAVSRAVFPLPEWLSLARPAVSDDGVILAMEGKVRSELPDGAIRHEYRLGDRTRAIISCSRL